MMKAIYHIVVIFAVFGGWWPEQTSVYAPSPTRRPTPAPTCRPTFTPGWPTPAPTDPTAAPTHTPTAVPTYTPGLPTPVPTVVPTTGIPTPHPTAGPGQPTVAPSPSPTVAPTHTPTLSPTHTPITLTPTCDPTAAPTSAAATDVGDDGDEKGNGDGLPVYATVLYSFAIISVSFAVCWFAYRKVIHPRMLLQQRHKYVRHPGDSTEGDGADVGLTGTEGRSPLSDGDFYRRDHGHADDDDDNDDDDDEWEGYGADHSPATSAHSPVRVSKSGRVRVAGAGSGLMGGRGFTPASPSRAPLVSPNPHTLHHQYPHSHASCPPAVSDAAGGDEEGNEGTLPPPPSSQAQPAAAPAVEAELGGMHQLHEVQTEDYGEHDGFSNFGY